MTKKIKNKIMALMILFLLCSAGFIWMYFFYKKNRFSFDNLFFGLWFLCIAVAQLRLSPLESVFDSRFWIAIGIFSLFFYLTYNFLRIKLNKKIKNADENIKIDENFFVIVLSSMFVVSAIANIYIFFKFGTMPIFASAPDRMRFIINKETFGLIEYLSFLPRIFIPLAFVFLFKYGKLIKKWKRIIVYLIIFLGFLMLLMYASRVVILFPIILSFFCYLILKIKNISLKQIIISSFIVVFSVLFFSISIPIFRQYITYKDYYGSIYNKETGELDLESTPFNYILDISKINIPKKFNLLVPLYIIPSFNLQTFYHATSYFGETHDFYNGKYLASISDSFVKAFGIKFFNINIKWGEIFLPWWNTGTFLFDFWADFGYLGMILAAVLFGSIFATIYVLATKKNNLAFTLLFAYFNFFIVMSIYTNYIRRQEFYLDIAFIIFVNFIFYFYEKKRNNISKLN